ncbi:MAG: group 1 glycosyl transferase [Candidatus Kerfeldbacteria bacterium CG_4_10_14_0_8_um_filter_42_10]|uniref:Group 1 glycosyl transferase n=1 Tax=Candidatus Kerfeldbacteria bacterium CG_4_10_14_0_8_um_filter_42_10 TaxID=2014248 RepID=A0A2M7RGU0_9BACT|nr:MAG: group 1 glycosyl transferase [Candidatus Kerfeldbacteria bacterium CG_4_10_14_0_8_um_filter_42_10]
MKILQINKFYFEQGGTERYFFDLIKLLEKHGHKVIPFAMEHKNNLKTDYARYFPSFVDTLRLGISPNKLKAIGRMFYSFEAKRQLEALIKKERPQIAHIHNIYHQISPSILPVLKKYQIPAVMTVHDYKLICPNYTLYTEGAPCERCKGGRYCQAFYHRCLKDSYAASALVALEMHFHKWLKIYQNNIDLFITPSDFVREKLTSFGINAQKIMVLPHFIESQTMEPEYNEGKYLLYAGRLKKEKGVDVLIEAMKNLPQVELRIAGTGPDEQALKKSAEGLSNVKFLGQVAQSEMAGLYRQALAVVIPSRVWETFGLTAAESMAFGKPVIAAKMGALPELVKEGQTGSLFESENPADLAKKIEFLVKNTAQARTMGEAGQRNIIGTLSEEKHYQDLMKIYHELSTKH